MAREHAERESERTRADGAGGAAEAAGATLQHAGNQTATAVLDTYEIGRASDAAELQADVLAASALAGAPGAAAFAPGAAGVLRRSSDGPDRLGGTQVDPGTAAAISEARGGGSPLPGPVRGDLEKGFGTGLGGVRVHTDSQADSLSRKVDAVAFTTGQDVFFRQGTYAPSTDVGRQVIAHEVAHAVQGGSTIRRLMSAQQFKLSTNTTGHMRGDAIKAIDKHMAEIEKLKAESLKLSAPTPPPRRAAPGAPPAPPPPNPAKIANLQKRIKLIEQMEDMARGWIGAHTLPASEPPVTTGATTATTGTTATTATTAPTTPVDVTAPGRRIDPKRKQRMDGVRVFLLGGDYEHPANKDHKAIPQKTGIRALAAERADLEGQLTSAAGGALAGTTAPSLGEADKRHKKIQDKYQGDAKSMFNKLGPLVDVSIPNAGDSVEVDLEAKVPVDPSGIGFVSFHLVLTATRDSVSGEVVGAEGKDNVVIRGELMVGGGANVADILTLKGELGLYAEASANGTAGALTLLSFGVYKRWRESKIVPSGLISYMWSGRAGEFGYDMSESWANQVEAEQFADTKTKDENGDDDFEANDAYVETGGLGKLSGKGGAKFAAGGSVGAEIEASLTFGGGQRYSKKSIERAKGGTMATKADPTTGAPMSMGNSKLGTPNQVEKTDASGNKVKETAKHDSGPQQLTGDDTFYFEIEGKADLTPITGGIKIMGKFSRPSVRGLRNPNPWESDAVELQVNGGFKIPAAGNSSELASKVLRPIATGVAALPGLVRTLIEQKRQEQTAGAKAAKGLGSAFDLAQASVPTLSQYVKQFGETDNFSTVGKDLKEAAGPTIASSLELNVAIGYDFVGKTLAVELSTKDKVELEIPLFFKGSIQKKKRILALTWDKPGLPNVK